MRPPLRCNIWRTKKNADHLSGRSLRLHTVSRFHSFEGSRLSLRGLSALKSRFDFSQKASKIDRFGDFKDG